MPIFQDFLHFSLGQPVKMNFLLHKKSFLGNLHDYPALSPVDFIISFTVYHAKEIDSNRFA